MFDAGGRRRGRRRRCCCGSGCDCGCAGGDALGVFFLFVGFLDESVWIFRSGGVFCLFARLSLRRLLADD